MIDIDFFIQIWEDFKYEILEIKMLGDNDFLDVCEIG